MNNTIEEIEKEIGGYLLTIKCETGQGVQVEDKSQTYRFLADAFQSKIGKIRGDLANFGA